MRFHFSCVLLVLGLGLGGCGDFELAPCGWPGCGEGERCVDNACVACGDAGEVCCNLINGGEHCTESNTGCNPADGAGTCTKECGGLGMACCNSDCDAGLTCGDGVSVCVTIGPDDDACYNLTSGDPYVFTIIGADCASRSQTFWTTTLEQAEECRDEWSTAGPGEELCATGATPDSSNVCEVGESFGWTFNHCSAEQLAACQASVCGEPDGCSWTTCP